jgi:hypothetical protein
VSLFAGLTQRLLRDGAWDVGTLYPAPILQISD